MSSRKVRVKKLSVKTALPVLREDQIDHTEYEALANETQIATGVDQAEEKEEHLIAALKGGTQEIPVPIPLSSDGNYNELYPSHFRQPSSYIRFSQTVEECISCHYDMSSEDDAFLKTYNSKTTNPAGPLSEDDFERIMEVYEDTAAEQTPFASVDNTVVQYDMMVPGLNHFGSQSIMQHAKAIYEYWKTKRQEMSNKPIHPILKFETHQDSDDTDPYVCFRRREARQTRKTRARDNKIAETLKRLRRELEDGRQLIILSAERETVKRDLLFADRAIFEERARLKMMKIRLGIKDTDDDLINQKPQKRKVPDAPVIQRPPGANVRAAARTDSRAVESDLVLLSDRIAEKLNEFRADIELKVQNHRKWNANHIDLTRDPLSPVREQGMFRQAKTEYLMTPPGSVSEEMDIDQDETTELMSMDRQRQPLFQFQPSRPCDAKEPPHPAFRRRIGRLNRLWIDRRGMATPPRQEGTGYCDRWKFDSDSEDDEPPVYHVDPFDTRALKFRATIPLNPTVYTSRRPDGPPNGHAGQRALPPAQGAPQVASSATQAQAQAQAQAQVQAQAQAQAAQVAQAAQAAQAQAQAQGQARAAS